MRRTAIIFSMLLCIAALSGCGIYSFSGTSIKPDVQTITIEPVVNNALKVNPTLANSFTEALKDKFKKLTSLKEEEEDGDLQLIVTIESYDVRAQAITADEVAAQNRLTVTANATFINVLHPEENFEKNNLLDVYCTASAGDEVKAYKNTTNSMGTILFKADSVEEMIEITGNIEKYYTVEVE